jgi:hypothetical protein
MYRYKEAGWSPERLYTYSDTYLRPIIDKIRVVRKNIRHICIGSLKNRIPMSAVPAAPIPVHTAYAVPRGKTSVALYNRYILKLTQTKNPNSQKKAVLPLLSFAFARQVVNPTSNKPAMINKIQAIEIFKLQTYGCSGEPGN